MKPRVIDETTSERPVAVVWEPQKAVPAVGVSPSDARASCRARPRAGRVRPVAVVLLLTCVVLMGVSCTSARPPDQTPTAAVVLPSLGESGPQASAIELRGFIDNLTQTNGLWGVSIKSLSTGQRIYGKNEGKLFIPASNMKLFTTAVALVRLGPDFRYSTGLYAGGAIREGVLEGDLLLRGSGDPTISWRFHDRPTAVFEEWADVLKRRGIREIRGDVVGDDTQFDSPGLGRGWAWDDELFAYSARISAVSFNDNCFDAIVSPADQPGEPARISIRPETAYARIVDKVQTSNPGDQTELDARRVPGTSAIELSGRIEVASAPRRVRFAVANPTLFAVTVLKEVMERKGILIRGNAVDIDSTGRTPNYSLMGQLVSHRSETLGRIVEHINKESQNLYAELLFRTLGTVYRGHGSAQKSVQVMKETLASMGIPAGSMAISDGSGLSRLNLVSPSQVVQLLEYMSKHPYFWDFYRSLPVAGVDGTLAERMKTAGDERRVSAKTGTLTHTASLSGYLPEQHGGWVAFSIISNNFLGPASEARLLQDTICRSLSRSLEITKGRVPPLP